MISVGFKTDRGMLRRSNEDSVFVLPKHQLYIVADGVGGHNSGEVASRMAVETIAEYAQNNPPESVKGDKALKKYFEECMTLANSRIYSEAQKPGRRYGMATTCVLLYIREDTAFVVNIGDSRCYLIRDAVMRQISQDHSVVMELVRSGVLSEEDAKTSPDRNQITRALGGEEKAQPDFFSFKLYPADTVLLCSDGLYSEVEEDRMADLCSRYKTMHRLTKQLVDEANKNGGKDNISVVCVRIS